MKRILTLLAAAILAAPCLSLAAVANDEVTSVKLKEADGTSGQNTNSGAGVKTGHLQNAAVTSTKIAAGAVGAAQLAPAAVGTAAIVDGSITAAKLAPGVLTPPVLADGSVTTAKLADGAVTDAKITGPISAAKLGAHAHTAATDLVGAVPANQIQTYARELVVHQGPADGVSTFNSVVAAYAAAAADGWTHIRVLPGVYTESADIPLDKWVVLEGTSAESTVIQGAANQASQIYRLNVLRHLTFSGAFSWGAMVLDHVTANGNVFTRQALTVLDSRVNGHATAMGLLTVRTSEINGSVNAYAPQLANSIVDTVINPAAGAYEAIQVINGVSPGTTFAAATVIQNVRTSGASNNGLSATQGVRIVVRGSTLAGVNDGIWSPSTANVLDVRDSALTGGVAAIEMPTASAAALTLVNTQLAGPVVIGGPARLLNCFDAAINPIPNQ